MEEQIPLLRCLRDAEAESAEEEGVFYVPTAEAAVQMLGRTEGNVFVTTGSKELRALQRWQITKTGYMPECCRRRKRQSSAGGLESLADI